jgi:integrase
VRSPLHGLRFHDPRHHAITELAESQASERTIMAIAGHVSTRMLEHYSHIRMDAKRKAQSAKRSKPSVRGVWQGVMAQSAPQIQILRRCQ